MITSLIFFLIKNGLESILPYENFKKKKEELFK